MSSRERERERDACDVDEYQSDITSDHDYLDRGSNVVF